MIRPRAITASVAALFLSGSFLSGCATSALEDAPSSPDHPWQAGIDAHGRLALTQDSAPQKAHTLKLPSEFGLPAAKLPDRGSAPEVKPDRRYALAELIDIAQSTNPDTRIAWNAARDVALASGIARSLYLPHLAASVVGGVSRMKRSNNGDTLNHHSGSSGDGELQSVSLSWLLFDFGKRSAVLKAAKLQTLASDIRFTGAHQKVIYDVTTAYYLNAAAQARVKLIERALANARDIERATKARLVHGQNTVIDVAQAEQATAQAKLRLVQAEGEAQNRYLALMTAMGLPPTTQIILQTGEDRTPTQTDVRMTERMVRDAVAQRPDVQAAYASARASESQVKAARAEFLPKIFVSGNATYSTGSLGITGLPGIGSDSSPSLNIGNSSFSGLILGGITVPIYDGGMRLAQLRQAQDKADTDQQRLKHLQDKAVQEVVSAQNGLHTGIMAVDASRAMERSARTGFDAALAAYRSGEGSITRMLELQNGLFNATVAVSDSTYATFISAASLAFATGALDQAPPPTDQPKTPFGTGVSFGGNAPANVPLASEAGLAHAPYPAAVHPFIKSP